MSPRSNSNDAERMNRAMWDELAPVHMKAYNEVALLRQGCEVLDEIELREVGDVQGKSLLHLQCHIGTDTLAWARHGADVTGVDFSGESIACAKQLAAELGVAGRFIHSNIYSLRDVHRAQYDIVYTSKGVLCWLKDLTEWGHLVAHYLKPGGVFYLMETHPTAMALEEEEPGRLAFTYPYFHKEAPTEWAPGDPDYADRNYIRKNGSAEWEWSLGAIVNALLDAGLQLEFIHEYEKLFFQLFRSMTTDDGRWFRLPEFSGKLPLLMTLRAKKPPF